MANKDVKSLLTMFKLKINPNAKKSADKVTFLDVQKDEKGEIKKISNVSFPPLVQTAFNYWIDQHDSEESWKHREELWYDLDNLYYNCSLNSRAVDLMADEVVQADLNMQPIFVEGKTKVKKAILKLFDNLGIYKLLRSLAQNIVQYGNAGWILSLGKHGINEVVPINIFQLKDRLEFTPHEIDKEIKNNKSFGEFAKLDKVDQLINTIKDKENITSAFKSYLLGFQIGDYILPPWRFLHFRNLTTKSPFKPFGIPFFVHMIAPYRQWDSAMTFQVMARALQFPIEKYEINMPNVVDPAEKMSKLAEFIEKLDNIGISKSNKEEKSLGQRIFTIKDLYDYELVSNDVDMKKMDDLELLRDDLIVATRLPRNIIDPNDGGFGDSGVSLIQKWKEFARNVFHIQSIILENITQMVKIHLIQTKNFQESDLDFILSMPYPESQINDDIINSQQSLISLVNDIIDLLSDRLLDGESLPDELINDIMHQIMPYDQKRIDDWMKQIKKQKKVNDEEPEDGGDDNLDQGDVNAEEDEESVDKNKKQHLTDWKKLEEKVGKKKLRETVDNIIFDAKFNTMREGIIKGKHFYTSTNKYLEFDAKLLREFRKERVKKAGFDDQGIPIKIEQLNEEYIFEFDKKKSKKKKNT